MCVCVCVCVYVCVCTLSLHKRFNHCKFPHKILYHCGEDLKATENVCLEFFKQLIHISQELYTELEYSISVLNSIEYRLFIICSLRVTFLYDSSLAFSINCYCLERKQDSVFALKVCEKSFFLKNCAELIGKHLLRQFFLELQNGFSSICFTVIFVNCFRATAKPASICINKYLNNILLYELYQLYLAILNYGTSKRKTKDSHISVLTCIKD